MDVLPTGSLTLLPNDYTPESLWKFLSEHPECAGYWDECGGLLKKIKGNNHYQSTLDDTMCTIFTLKSSYTRSLIKETYSAEDIFMNVSWATTMSKFKKNVNLDDFGSGFLARFIVVYAEAAWYEPRRNMTEEDLEKKQVVKDRLQRIYDVFHNKKYYFEFSEEALEAYEDWACEKMALIPKDKETEDYFGATTVRLFDYAIKFSALYEVDNLSNLALSNLINLSIIISKNSMLKSIEKINYLISSYKLLSAKLLSLNASEADKNINTLKGLLADGEWKMRSWLTPRLHMYSRYVDELFRTAIDSGLIEKKNEGRTVFIRLKEVV